VATRARPGGASVAFVVAGGCAVARSAPSDLGGVRRRPNLSVVSSVATSRWWRETSRIDTEPSLHFGGFGGFGGEAPPPERLLAGERVVRHKGPSF